MLIGRFPKRRQVESSENPVPVRIIALGFVELAGGFRARALADFAGDKQHPLMEVVALGILEEELAEEPAAQEPPRLGWDFLLEGPEALEAGRLEGPFQHLLTRGRGQVYQPERR